jgi:chemotaxis-related protein WspD
MTALPPVVEHCWSRIGVGGDRSCPELARYFHCSNCPVFAAAARSFFDRPAPAEYLAEWSAALAQQAGRADRDQVSVAVFRLGPEWLALAVHALVEVAAPRPTHRVPHRSNAVLAGLVNLRGQLHLLMSLHGVLGLDADADGSPTRRLVVLADHAERWVFAADEVAAVERLPRARLSKVPGTLANPAHALSQAVFEWHGRRVGLLDEQRVFNAFRSLGA